MTTAAAVQFSPPDPFVSLVQASKLTGFPRQTLLTMAVKGEITARPVAGRIVVLRSDVDRLVAERNKAK